MVRILQAVSVLSLIFAAAVFTLCVVDWLDDTPGTIQINELSVTEQFKQINHDITNERQETISPLVRQAEAFALFLNPPQPQKPRQVRASASDSKSQKPVVNLPKITPKFILLGTSYYRARPDESLALVSEPGNNPRWVKQGTNLGHFVVEKIERGTIVYREGDRIGQMAVNTELPVDIEPAGQTTLASNEPEVAPVRTPGTNKPVKTRPRIPMHKLGPPRPERKIVAFDDKTTSS